MLGEGTAAGQMSDPHFVCQFIVMEISGNDLQQIEIGSECVHVCVGEYVSVCVHDTVNFLLI